MGMFNTVKCYMPLPDGYTPDEGGDFQSKQGLEPLLETYIIDADGTLYQDTIEPSQRVNFTGALNFYEDACRDYTAMFADGHCVCRCTGGRHRWDER